MDGVKPEDSWHAVDSQIQSELQLFVLNAARDKDGDLTLVDDYVANIGLCESLNQCARAWAVARYQTRIHWTASSTWSLVRSILERVDPETVEDSPYLFAAKMLLGVGVNDSDEVVVPGRDGMTLAQLRSSDRRLNNLRLQKHLDLRKAFVLKLFPHLNEYTALRPRRPAVVQIGVHLAQAIKYELENGDLPQYGSSTSESPQSLHDPADLRRVDGVVIGKRANVAALGQSDAIVEHPFGGQRQSPLLDAAAQEAARQLLWHLEELGVVLLAFHLAVTETYLPQELADAVYEGIRSRSDLIYKALFEYVNADFFGVELVRTSSGRQLLGDLGIPTHLEVLGDFALSDEERSLARAAIGENTHLEPRTLLEVLTRETEAETVIDAWRDALTVAEKFFDWEQKAVKSNNHGIDMRWPMAAQVESVRKAFLLNLSDVIIILRDTGIASGHTETWMYRRLRRVWETLVNATHFTSDYEYWPPSFRDVLEQGTYGIVMEVAWADQWRSFRGGAYDETQRTFWDELISPRFREEAIVGKKWLREYLERSASDPDFRRQEMEELLKDSDEEWLREYGDPTLLDEHPSPDDHSPTSDLPPLFAD